MKIFLAEEKSSADEVGSFLRKEGYEVEIVYDGVSCLERMYSVMPNILILNTFLPEIDGHQLCYLIRSDEKYANIPIILIESPDKKIFLDEALQIEGKIKKPYKLEELIVLIDDVIKKRKVQPEKASIEIEKLTEKLIKQEEMIKELTSSIERFKISKSALEKVNSILTKQIQELTFSHKVQTRLSFSFMDVSQTTDTFFDILKEDIVKAEVYFAIVWEDEEGRLYIKTDNLLSDGYYDELYKAVEEIFSEFNREMIRIVKGGMIVSSERPKPQYFVVSLLPLENEGKKRTLILGASKTEDFPHREREAFEKLAKHSKIGFSHAIFFEELERIFFNTMTALVETIEGKQKYQEGHSGRVVQYAKSICEALNLSKEDTALICDAALLHDIGKMSIPDEILNKPGKLTKEEFATIQLHPRIGEEILKSFKTFQNMLPIICYHHERFGGGGYGKLKGDQIPLGARILAVADSFDAMLSDRPYRKALTPDAAIAELKEGVGTQFDPLVVKAFLKGWLENRIKVSASV
ncbi:TPA: hypothetical protein DCX16_02755 [bacterium]|nr:hypothetical protein [bacterium]